MKLKILLEDRNDQCLLNNTEKHEHRKRTLKILENCQIMMYMKQCSPTPGP